jgi:hypothetical protein
MGDPALGGLVYFTQEKQGLDFSAIENEKPFYEKIYPDQHGSGWQGK